MWPISRFQKNPLEEKLKNLLQGIHLDSPTWFKEALKKFPLENSEDQEIALCEVVSRLNSIKKNIPLRYLTKENFDTIIRHNNVGSASEALKCLKIKNVLEGVDFPASSLDILQNPDPRSVYEMLSLLKDDQLLNKNNYIHVTQYQEPEKIFWLSKQLKEWGMLNQGVLDKLLMTLPSPDALGGTLKYWQDTNLLTQDNLDRLLNSDLAYLYSRQALQAIWDRIPNHKLTQPVLEQLFELALQDDREQTMEQYIQELFREPQRENEEENNINFQQNTHTASVHQSVSQSALALHQIYGKQIAEEYLGVVIKEIKRYVDSLPAQEDSLPSLKKQAAQNFIQRIIEDDSVASHKDQVSDLTVKQLLALVWCAICDDKKREASLEDAQSRLIEGFYDIQRGYNINASQALSQFSQKEFNQLKNIEETLWILDNIQILDAEKQRDLFGKIQTLKGKEPQGAKFTQDEIDYLRQLLNWNDYKALSEKLVDNQNLDDEKADKPICVAGTFNKLVEILQGVHPDAEITLISQVNASQKFPCVVREACKAYLTRLADTNTADAYSKFVRLIGEIRKEKDVSPIWHSLKPEVSKQMLGEFGSLYGNDPQNTHFVSLIDRGIYVDLEGISLDKLQTQAQNSKGYRLYQQKQTLRDQDIVEENHAKESGYKTPISLESNLEGTLSIASQTATTNTTLASTTEGLSESSLQAGGQVIDYREVLENIIKRFESRYNKNHESDRRKLLALKKLLNGTKNLNYEKIKLVTDRKTYRHTTGLFSCFSFFSKLKDTDSTQDLKHKARPCSFEVATNVKLL